MTRSLYAVIESRLSWSRPLQFSLYAKAKLAVWSSELRTNNTQPIWHSPSAVRVFYSDASDTGFGVM